MRFRHGDVIGEIDNLPGCSQIAVLHSVFIPAHLRGVGKGKIAHAERLVEADHLGYNACLCTVNLNNTAQLKSLMMLVGYKFLILFLAKPTIMLVFL